MSSKPSEKVSVVVLISADAEWEAVLDRLGQPSCAPSSLGEWLRYPLLISGNRLPVIFFHGGWGKIAAAASTQYVIDRWCPELIINLGTCGGFAGRVERGEILLVERTLVYDILEQMGEIEDHIAHYTTELDVSWLSPNHPRPIRRTLLVSADRDLLPGDILRLAEQYGAVAGDWESGAIAWVAARNACRCLILRGVTDLVSLSGGEVYGDLAGYRNAAHAIMRRLLDDLPAWLAAAGYPQPSHPEQNTTE
jgi:adenosylhomocysteine nucleosidase